MPRQRHSPPGTALPLSLPPPPPLPCAPLLLLATLLAALLLPTTARPAPPPAHPALIYDPLAGLSRAAWHYVDPSAPPDTEPTPMRAADHAAFLYAAALDSTSPAPPVPLARQSSQHTILVDVPESAPAPDGTDLVLGDGLDGAPSLRAASTMPDDVSDAELLDILGVGGGDGGGGGGLAPLVRQSGRRVRVRGSKSELQVRYGPGVPKEARTPFEDSMRAWADTFPSSIPIRIDFDWREISFGTLAATTTPFFIRGSRSDADRLDTDTVYGSVMAASLQKKDFVQGGNAHIIMVFNSKASWHFGTDRTPSRKWDLRTTCLHEICHGLFFSGVVQADSLRKVAGFSNGDSRPARFDRFLAAGNDAGLATTCSNNDRNFYNAITNSGLRFLDREQSGVDFGLYSPFNYQGGSSTYHNDPKRIDADCTKNGIPSSQCSDLMTQRLPNGYTQRSIGEPVVRIMRSMRSVSRGVTGSESCNVRPGEPGQDDGSPFGDIGIFQSDFKLPQWAIYTIIGMGVLGAASLVWALCSSLVRRK